MNIEKPKTKLSQKIFAKCFLIFSLNVSLSFDHLHLVYNEPRKQNFIQVNNLPLITTQQSYQLWSLKLGVSPIPLTVFQGDEGIFIPVDFEDNTGTYAITIEPLGGQNAPTLSNLIATVTVG